MKRIIDISDEDYREAINDYEEYRKHKDLAINSVSYAIANSTPLTECQAEDCISREATKQAIRDFFPNLDDRCEINSVINMQPSVYPKSDNSVQKKCACYNCEHFEIKGMSHCTIHEESYGDIRCFDYKERKHE